MLDPSHIPHIGPLGRYLMGVAVCSAADEIFIADEARHRVVGLSVEFVVLASRHIEEFLLISHCLDYFL